jgi:hypothetical protein
MAKTQGGTSRKKTENERVSDLKHLLIAGSVVGGILLTLVIAAVLRVDPEEAAILPAPPSTPEPALASAAPLPGPGQDQADPVAVDGDQLALRALDDQRRLATTADEWTLQFMVTCKEETAREILGRTRGDRRLFLLPILLEDSSRSCSAAWAHRPGPTGCIWRAAE